MLALRWTGRDLALDRDWSPPPLAPGEALIRPTLTGVDRAHASPQGQPRVLGHEFVGIVEAADQPRWIGKRVVATPVIACGACDLCKGGLPTHCRDRRILGSTADGALAQRLIVPTRNLVEVPATLADDAAVFAATVAAAAHAAQLVRIEGRPYVTVLGDSVLALCAAQALTRLNATVRLVGRREDRLELCARWGIKHRPDTEIGRRADQDTVVVCGGATALDLALKLVRPRGKIVVMADATHDTPVDAADDTQQANTLAQSLLDQLATSEIQVLGARGGSIPDALALLAKGQVDVAPLITARRRLADALAALQLARSDAALKILLDAA